MCGSLLSQASYTVPPHLAEVSETTTANKIPLATGQSHDHPCLSANGLDSHL